MFKKKSHTSFENNDFLEDIDAIMKKEKANYISNENSSQNLLDNNQLNNLHRPSISNLDLALDLLSPIHNTERKDSYLDDFDHLSEFESNKSVIIQNQNKDLNESFILKDIDLKSDINPPIKTLEKSIKSLIIKDIDLKPDINPPIKTLEKSIKKPPRTLPFAKEDKLTKEIGKLEKYLTLLEKKLPENSPSKILNENNKLHQILKNFSSLLTDYLENTPIKNPRQEPIISLESLEQTKRNNSNTLKNLYKEYNKLLKINETTRDSNEIDLDLQRTSYKIKEISLEINQAKLDHAQNSKELKELETLGFPFKKREYQRSEKECFRYERRNQDIKEKNYKIELKLDKSLGRLDILKEKHHKHLIVAKKLHINLDPILTLKYAKIKEKIKIEASNFSILNKRDEMNYKGVEKKKEALFDDIKEIEEKTGVLDRKIKDQEEFLCKSIENMENDDWKLILLKKIDPRRLFLEKPFRFYQKKTKIIEKELKKPISLMDLNRNDKDSYNNSNFTSIEKSLNKVNKDKKVYESVFSVPFRIKNEKKRDLKVLEGNLYTKEELKERITVKMQDKEGNNVKMQEKEGNNVKIQEKEEDKEKIQENNKNLTGKTFNFNRKIQEQRVLVSENEENPSKIKDFTIKADDFSEEVVLEPKELEIPLINSKEINEIPIKYNGIKEIPLIYNEKPIIKLNETPPIPIQQERTFNFNRNKKIQDPFQANNIINELNDKEIKPNNQFIEPDTNKFLNQMDSKPKNSNLSQKKNIFQENNDDIFEIPELKEKTSLNEEKNTKIIEDNSVEYSKDLNPVKNYENSEKNKEFPSIPIRQEKTFNFNRNKKIQDPFQANNIINELNDKAIKANNEILEPDTNKFLNPIDSKPKNLNFNQKKNIFQENNDDIFDIPELKDKTSLNQEKSTKIYENSSFDYSKDLNHVKNYENIEKNHNSQKLRIKQEKKNSDKVIGGLINSNGGNTFFDDLDFN